MNTTAYYQKRFSCKKKITKNLVCHCPSGFSGVLCQNLLPNQCYVSITDPNLAAGCNYEDSDQYVYSIPGYDPCNFYDFSKKYTIKFRLICKPSNAQNYVLTDVHPEGPGYAYKNVLDLKKPTFM
jgi:hypothetical protein